MMTNDSGNASDSTVQTLAVKGFGSNTSAKAKWSPV